MLKSADAFQEMYIKNSKRKELFYNLKSETLC